VRLRLVPGNPYRQSQPYTSRRCTTLRKSASGLLDDADDQT
jgi:hypothetical protein